MDTACARLSLGQNATPPLIEDALRQLTASKFSSASSNAKTAIGVDHSERLANIAKQKTEVAARLKTLEERRDKKFSLVPAFARSARNSKRAARTSSRCRCPQAMPSAAGTAAQPATDARRSAPNSKN